MATTHYRIVGGSLPQDVDSDGYDTREAAEAMASEYAEGEYRIEEYRRRPVKPQQRVEAAKNRQPRHYSDDRPDPTDLAMERRYDHLDGDR